MGKFELFMGHLGNGLIVCNKAVEEHGDYKKVCHIQPWGKITWYTKTESIPGDAFEKIVAESERMKEKFNAWLDGMPVSKRYFTLFDYVPFGVQVNAIEMIGNTERKIEYMKNYLYEVGGRP